MAASTPCRSIFAARAIKVGCGHVHPYLTAPKVRPRASWRWVSQPKTMIGATEASDAVESLAQKNPSGLENDAMATASVPAFTAVTLMHQKDSFQDRITAISAVEATPGAASGSTTKPSCWSGRAPSTRAASTISSGTSLK